MRMQLKASFLILFLTGIVSATYAQDEQNLETKSDAEPKGAEIDFLFNYYKQDGNNAAVTGGRGTEELNNVAPSVIFNIPLDSTKTLVTNFGFDKYSSASTDRIDNNVSSASSSDTRVYFNASYKKKNPYRKETYTYKVGISSEFDYLSTSFGLGWAKESKNGDRELNVNGTVYLDTWTLIYPAEMRNGQELLANDKRQSYNFSVNLAQVLTKRLQGSLSAEYVLQTGLLSTPFHRVYFNDGIDNPIFKSHDIERLPDSRTKIPLGVRLNYYLNDLIVLRGYYRYYWDDFDITAHTFNIETPVKVGRFFTVYPFYRYHTQTAAKYFAPYGLHLESERYYTSDYDLSAINSYTMGIGFKYSPLYGLARFRGPFSQKTGRITQLKSIDVRFADYTREGNNQQGGQLDAFSISFDLIFTF